MKPVKALAAALGLVGVVNAFVLCGVAYNRSGHEAVLELTERELAIDKGNQEDTGMQLRLDSSESMSWSREKVSRLGFDADLLVRLEDHSMPSKRMFALLEYDGAAWQKWLDENEKEILKLREDRRRGKTDEKEFKEELQKRLLDEEIQSKLFVVDVGLDARSLWEAHPDTKRYAVVPCLVSVSAYISEKNEKDMGNTADPNESRTVYSGSVRLLLNEFHVEEGERSFFQPLANTDKSYWINRGDSRLRDHWDPRYKVTLAFGKRHEPWIVNCALLQVPLPEVVPK